jgi:hypothetical protein
MQMSSDPRGRVLFDAHGEKLGSVEELYPDLGSDRLDWALISTGVLGMGGKTMVPLEGAHETADGIAVPYAKDQVHNAPQVREGDLGAEDHARLARYYGLGGAVTADHQAAASGEGAVPPAGASARAGQEASPTVGGSDRDLRSETQPSPAADASPPGADISASTKADPSGPRFGSEPAAQQITPGDLADYGGQLAAYGQQLAEYGERLASFAQRLAEQQRGLGGR